MCIQEAHKTLPALLLNDTVLLLLQGQQGLCLFHMPRYRNLTSACTLGYRLGRKSCSRRVLVAGRRDFWHAEAVCSCEVV